MMGSPDCFMFAPTIVAPRLRRESPTMRICLFGTRRLKAPCQSPGPQRNSARIEDFVVPDLDHCRAEAPAVAMMLQRVGDPVERRIGLVPPDIEVAAFRLQRFEHRLGVAVVDAMDQPDRPWSRHALVDWRERMHGDENRLLCRRGAPVEHRLDGGMERGVEVRDAAGPLIAAEVAIARNFGGFADQWNEVG